MVIRMNGTPNLPYIPEYITVHLGPAGSNAENVTVSFPEYIKNVASSEIYPTWPENAIRANILAQISFALNRVYTEYYRSRGYDFDITNSTATDQSFVRGRDFFENISQIVDEIFNDYIIRQGSVEPLFAAYCDGVRVQCNGLSQWGSVALAEQGLTPYQILTNYFGQDINIVRDVPVQGLSESYPGYLLALGTLSNYVGMIQLRLNRIARNYPSIPKIERVNGIYGIDTENAVREFQRVFSLTQDGIVGRATWYKIAQIYNAVKRITDIYSEGLSLAEVTDIYSTTLQVGSTGGPVRELQYYLSFISQFNNAIPPIAIDGIFGQKTRAAVESFQREYGLDVTGVVTQQVGREIYSVYIGMINSLPPGWLPENAAVYPGAPLRIGSRSESVAILQDYLNFISDTYTQIPKLAVDGIFGPATNSAVEEYQRIFGIEVNGVVDSNTWNSIVRTYLSLTEGTQGQWSQYGGGTGPVAE